MSPKERERLVTCLAEHDDVVAAYLFGSAARGNGSPLSDVDIAILWEPCPPNPLRARARLAEDLARSASVTVDLVVLNDASPAIAGRVLREGRLLLCRDDVRRVRFEIDAVRRDLDTLHLRRLFDRTLSRSIRLGEFYG